MTFIQGLLGRLTSTTPVQREIIARAMAVAEDQGRRMPLPSVTVPLSVYEAVQGSWRSALPLAAATTFVYLGAHALDDVADREVPAAWGDWSSDQIVVAAVALLGSLPHLILSGLDEPPLPNARVSGLSRRLAAGLWSMADGQLQDLQANGGPPSPALSEAIVAAKSGAAFAMFAGLAAALATDDGQVIGAYEAFGRAFGIAGQLTSDCQDVFVRRPSPDLLNGRPTLPITFAIVTTAGVERAELLALLERARTDPDRHPELARRLAMMGSLQYVGLKVEAQVRLGMAALDQAGGGGHAVDELRRMLRQTSMLRDAAVSGS